MTIPFTRLEVAILAIISFILILCVYEIWADSKRIQPIDRPERVVWTQLNEPAMSSWSLYRTKILEGTLYFSNGGLLFVPKEK